MLISPRRLDGQTLTHDLGLMKDHLRCLISTSPALKCNCACAVDLLAYYDKQRICSFLSSARSKEAELVLL